MAREAAMALATTMAMDGNGEEGRESERVIIVVILVVVVVVVVVAATSETKDLSGGNIETS